MTDFYRGCPVDLARLSRLDAHALNDLLSVWRLTAEKARRARPRKADRARRP